MNIQQKWIIVILYMEIQQTWMISVYIYISHSINQDYVCVHIYIY